MVGNCSIGRDKYKKSHRAGFGIALSKEARGKGIGTALAQRTIELARKRMRGLEMIGLTVINYNARAQELYKKLGFVEVARIPRSVKEGKEYFDEYVMYLYL